MNYSINEISKLTDLSKYTLRYYEKEKLIPLIKRDSSGHRIYNEKDLEWIEFLINIKQTGMSIEDIRQFAKMKFDPQTMFLRKQMLLNHKKRIIQQEKQLHHALSMIDKKLDMYLNTEQESEL
ncbi:MerR family transcriptional regulator [Leuconostoc suionicum]|uniref:MerR family transcriptional regulator n=1 Tax=Leuconostoc suionicum TaxID=1511761 RepID=UPI0021AA9E45|nr:MerR family transcriptional regulator [Leuconostoc suionicum]MCT4381655.1 MerR family transcriptional regulator [Leuconostoc suionicum]